MLKLIFFIYLTLIITACSSAPKTQKHLVSQIISDSLRVRRTTTPPTDPKVGPGGPDYKADPKTKTDFECKKPQTLYENLDLTNIQSCLQSITKPIQVKYVLDFTHTPSWKLDINKDIQVVPPKCIQKYLSIIPVPREIFFQTYSNNGSLNCYSSFIDTNADQFLGAKVSSKNGFELNIVFPLTPSPQKKNDIKRHLISWSMAPFWSEDPANSEKNVISSLYVPESICSKCLGKEYFENIEKTFSSKTKDNLLSQQTNETRNTFLKMRNEQLKLWPPKEGVYDEVFPETPLSPDESDFFLDEEGSGTKIDTLESQVDENEESNYQESEDFLSKPDESDIDALKKQK